MFLPLLLFILTLKMEPGSSFYIELYSDQKGSVAVPPAGKLWPEMGVFINPESDNIAELMTKFGYLELRDALDALCFVNEMNKL